MTFSLSFFKGAKRVPKGAKRESKGTKREPKGSRREPKGVQNGAKGSPNGAKVNQQSMPKRFRKTHRKNIENTSKIDATMDQQIMNI